MKEKEVLAALEKADLKHEEDLKMIKKMKKYKEMNDKDDRYPTPIWEGGCAEYKTKVIYDI